jgi:hypothetical protein
MQYILDQREMNLMLRSGWDEVKALEDKMNKLCKMATNKIPMEKQGIGGLEPWGCIHNTPAKPKPVGGFCDECMVQKYCTMEKIYSDAKRKTKMGDSMEKIREGSKIMGTVKK